MTQGYGAVDTRVGKTAGGRYNLVRLLGKGGMGEVYEAQHAIIGRRFAVKFLHPHLASNSEAVARFQREAQAAGRLENENIVAVVDAGTADDGAPYLVMEYLEGENLAQLLVRGGPLPAPRAAYILIQACRGLAAAHSRGIVHRDIKPANLFICRRNDSSDLVKVLDFGIAKLHTGRAGTGLTQTGTTMGTPQYMSPEQARGAKEVDHRTDIYALGVVLYQILSGAQPHPGDSYHQILYHVLTQEPAPLDSTRPNLPFGLSAVVEKAMARNAGDRYASVTHLMGALIPFGGRAVVPVQSQVGIPSTPGDTLPTPGSLGGLVVPTPNKSKVSVGVVLRRHSRLFLLGVLPAIGVLLVIVVSGVAFRHQPKAQDTSLARGAMSAPAPVSATAASPLVSPTPTITQPATENPNIPPVRPTDPPALVEVEDAPPGLHVTVDGMPKDLPLSIPHGPTIHTLFFEAPGYDPREIRVDGMREHRSLVLTMKKLLATNPDLTMEKKPTNRRVVAGPMHASARPVKADMPTTHPSTDTKPIPSPVPAAPGQTAKPPAQNRGLILDF